MIGKGALGPLAALLASPLPAVSPPVVHAERFRRRQDFNESVRKAETG